MSTKSLNPPDTKRTIHIRIISRVNGQLRFGTPDEDNSWAKSEEEARKVAKQVVAKQADSPVDLQVHIKNHKNGGIHVIYSDQASNL